MSNLIIIDHSDLTKIVSNAIDMMANTKPYISQNQASKLIGRKRLERAMQEGNVRWIKFDMNKRNSPVRIDRKDVEKIINNK